MTDPLRESTRYPLLESLLRQKALALQGIYTIGDAATIFNVSRRTIQDWARDDKLPVRDLPGRGRFLSQDLEAFIERSLKRRKGPEDEPDSQDDTS